MIGIRANLRSAKLGPVPANVVIVSVGAMADHSRQRAEQQKSKNEALRFGLIVFARFVSMYLRRKTSRTRGPKISIEIRATSRVDVCVF